MNLVNKNRIVCWDNEDTPHRYFVNGVYIGSAYDIFDLMETVVYNIYTGREIKTKYLMYHDFNVLTESQATKLANFLDQATILTMEQELAIHNNDLEKLLKLI